MDVFISYRRDGGYTLARLLYECLAKANISAFLDLEELRAGPFNDKLYQAIADSENFLLVLPQNALDRCIYEDDWLRLEIEHAIMLKKNIIPIMADGFVFPQELPPKMAVLPYFNGVPVSREYFDASVTKIISMLHNVTVKDADLSLYSRHADVRYYYDEDELEKHRLRTEDKLLSKYEKPIIEKLLEGKKDVVCLDVNVLNPEGTIDRLSFPEITKVVGLTYSDMVAKQGNEIAPNNVRFLTAQFEADSFESVLETALDAVDADGFDFVCLSMAIMDFKKPFKVLGKIRDYMNDDAVLLVRDVDDGAVFAYPDNDGYFEKFQSLYIHNKYSGFRFTGRQIYSYLRKMEAKSITLEKYGINTADMSRRDKKALFECWFSFIPNDFNRMLREDAECLIAREAVDFCMEYYDDIIEQYFGNDMLFQAGYVIYSAKF